MDAITVLTYNEPEDAQPIVKRLSDAGIPATLHDERNVQKYWFISQPLAGIKVQVHKADYQKSKDLLEKWATEEDILTKAIHCPECGSSEVDYPQFTRKFILPTAYALLCKLGMTRTEFYCTHCHYTWPPSERIKERTDALGWPTRPKTPKAASHAKI
jgi:DNA-directed RNA polymerase subunit M/transcription elongation factor TFIIS